MPELVCKLRDCTLLQTGICLLNNPIDTCPNIDRNSAVSEAESTTGITEPELRAPQQLSRFPPSTSLGLDDARKIRSNRYSRLIGILGPPDSGKTACLVSLYLLLAHNRLTGFRFADSKSLMAFDEISRGARRWNAGTVTEQMTVHTEQKDERTVGLLHLRLRREADDARIDLLLPDLPGEWSTALIDSNRTERLRFLRAADCIWIVVDGRLFANVSQRHNAIHRTKLLLDRVAALCSPYSPRMYLVITRFDLAQVSEGTLQDLRDHAGDRGFDLIICLVASFSETNATAAGAGIPQLIGATVSMTNSEIPFWPATPLPLPGYRHFNRIREPITA